MRFDRADPTFTSRRALALVTSLAWLCASCANPGPPRPPSLHLPNPATDLAATRRGDVVDLTWTTPDRSTDDLPLSGPLTAELCEAPSTAEAACRPVQRLPVRPGPGNAALPLDSMSLAGPPALLVVRLRLLNAAGHSAALSAPALAVAGVAPPAVSPLRAQSSPGGVTLDWAPVPGGAPVMLHRVTVAPSTAAAGRFPGKARDSDVLLEAETPQHTDPGGTIDRSALEGTTYQYTAERVRTVRIDGQTLRLHSIASAPATVLVRDTFPPAPPAGLASVPGTPGQASPEIELSWEPNPEPDLVGYFVERADAATPTVWTRLTPNPIAAPAFRDTAVLPGHGYRYRVVAVDGNGNQSRPGTAIDETAAAPNP